MMYQKEKQKSENAVGASNVVSQLTENIEKMVRLKEVKCKECPDLNVLKEKCCDSNVMLAHTAFQGITKLVEQKILIPSQTVSSLISLLPSISHYSPLVTTIGNILLFDLQEQLAANDSYECQYNFTDKSHPLVIILKHNALGSWDAVYSFIRYLLFKHENIEYKHKIDLLETVFLYIFCNPTDSLISCKNQLFMLLLKQIDRSEIKNLIVRVLAWQKVDINYCWLIQETFHGLFDSSSNDSLLAIGALTPFLALAIKWLVVNGHNPCLWTDLLSEALNKTSVGASATLYLLSDVVLLTPAPFVNEIVDLCESIICRRRCNQFIAHKFAAFALIWLVNPSSLAEPVFAKLEYVVKFLNNNRDWNASDNSEIGDNPYYRVMENSSSDVKMAVEMSKLSDSWSADEASKLIWLKNLRASNNSEMQRKLQPFLSGLVLHGSRDQAVEICLDVLQQVSKTYGDLSFFQLCLVFFKLSAEFEPRNQLKYLTSLVELANSKENVPLIIGIIETLKNDNSHVMTSLVINLYLKLWKVDNRTYPHLHKALFDGSDEGGNSWETNVVKTIAVRDICRLSPGVHGKSLVSKLSKILNDCDNYASGLPSAVAIEAVVELCKAHVIDINGTWKALKPKLGQDKRVEVVISLCRLFGEIPSLKQCGAERDALQADVIPRLWNFALSERMEVVEAALRSLAKFPPATYGPKLLPDILKRDIHVPKQYYKAAEDVSKEKFIDDLEYVPGECWVELLLKIDPRALRHVGDTLILLLGAELEALPRRFFYQDDKLTEPSNYNHLPHSCIARALVAHVKKYLNGQEFKEKKISASVTESLRILSWDHSKRLPPLNWSFLENFFAVDDTCRNYSLVILARQAVSCRVSGKILENYIQDNLEHLKQADNCIFLYSALPYLCTALGGNVLRQFLDKTIRSCRNSSLNSDVSHHFERVASAIKTAMESKMVPEPRKALLATQIQSILAGIPPEHEVMKIYAEEFAAVLPPQTIEHISSPSSWREVTPLKLRQSVVIRSAIASAPETTNPLVWFNECIDAVASVLDEREFVLNAILEVLRRRRDVLHDDWINELMWRTQTSTSSKATPESVKLTLFLLDVFMSCATALAGYDCFVPRLHERSSRMQRFGFFPAALFDLLQRPNWTSLSSKVIDWIHSLSKWKNMPRTYCQILEQALLMLRTDKYCADKNKWLHLFHLPTLRATSTTKATSDGDIST